jgi:FkbM family methyltransferase
MGAINSTHLCGLDELIIFSFYAANTTRYRRTADIGANIGLHSILMSKLGCEVQCYEPDPVTFERLTSNLILNTVQDSIKSNQKAVSTKSGALEFTRVLGNTTGSHLSGAKTNPYGELERFSVEVVDFIDIMRTVDLMKIDVEGHEADILCKTQLDDWLGVDAIVEIGTVSNAQRVFDHLTDLNVNMFSQKTGWKHVESFEAVPKNYKEGSLFISVKDKMPWGESL